MFTSMTRSYTILDAHISSLDHVETYGMEGKFTFPSVGELNLRKVTSWAKILYNRKLGDFTTLFCPGS